MKQLRPLYPFKKASDPEVACPDNTQPEIAWHIHFSEKTSRVEQELNKISVYKSEVYIQNRVEWGTLGSLEAKRASPYSISLIRRPKVFLTETDEPCIDVFNGESMVIEYARTFTEAFTHKKPIFLGYSLNHVKGYRLLFTPGRGQIVSDRKMPSDKYEMKPKIFDGKSVKFIYAPDENLLFRAHALRNKPRSSFADWVKREIYLRGPEHALIHRLNAEMMKEALPFITGDEKPVKELFKPWIDVYEEMYKRGDVDPEELYNFLDIVYLRCNPCTPTPTFPQYGLNLKEVLSEKDVGPEELYNFSDRIHLRSNPCTPKR